MYLLNISALKFSTLLSLFGYRKEVILTNLKKSFPNYSESELIKTKSLFYSHLGQIIAESIKAFNISTKEIENRVEFTNPDLVQKYLNQNRDVIMVLGHYGNWEWALLATSHHFDQELVGIYKPLSSNYWDEKVKKMRAKFGATLVSMKDSYRYLMKNNNKAKIIGIIADQTPSKDEINYWTDFLNQKTPVFLGTEKLAKKLNCPVVFTHIERVKRGKYKISYELITETPQEHSDGEITDLHTRLLQEKIKEKPQHWLWSHKRWKHKQK
ncbi:MAG: lysophospholipid acyltransferase family protein [Flavobacteriales bacterium]|tara:strand:- start:6035 stop:6841 length:807 start_codon:yes stop_codon:yes gene_type:complete